MIEKEGIILDIGANLGIMAVKLAKRKSKSRIFAFEPIPYNMETLKKVIRFFKLKNISVFEYALGDKAGKIEMVMPLVGSVRKQGLSHVLHDSIADFNEGEKFTADIHVLDHVPEIKISGMPVTAIKIDVENFEYFVLKGGQDLLKKWKPLIYCELWDNQNREQCFELLKDLGYQAQVRKGNMLYPFEKGKDNTQNFFFVSAS
jgi:FkbM family methyltransferase